MLRIVIFLLFFGLLKCSEIEKFLLENKVKGYELLGGQCYKDLLSLKQGLQNPKNNLWALQMIDATSKIQSGILYVNSANLGNFDECVNSAGSVENNRKIVGKYCLGNLATSQKKNTFWKNVGKQLFGTSEEEKSLPIGFTWSGCLPSSCTAKDFNLFYNLILSKYKIGVQFSDISCQVKEKITLGTGSILTICFFAFIVLLMLMQTSYDIYCIRNGRVPHQLLTAFSMYTNSDKLFTFSKTNNKQLNFLNGMRFLSMFWVLMGHTYAFALSMPIDNFLNIHEWAGKNYSMLIISGTLSVDTFFFVGGILVSYLYFQAKEKHIKINIFIYYLHRYLRLTPALGALILFSIYVAPYLGNGPFWWKFIIEFKDLCEQSWWGVLLYVQNYACDNKMCLGHTWYLSVDMQLYFLSPFIMWFMFKYTKITIGVLCGVIVALMGNNFYLAWQNEYPAILSNEHVNVQDYMLKFYYKTHTRAGTWLQGILLGYVIFLIKEKRIKFQMHKVINILIWLLSLCVILICVFIGHDSLRGKEFNRWGNSLHITFVRQTWVCALSWMVCSCCAGHGGIINWFLSLPIFQIFNRLTYSIYLIHYPMLIYWYSTVKEPLYFDDYIMFYYFSGTFLFTITFSYFWVLAFESPIMVIEKIIFRPKKSQEN